MSKSCREEVCFEDTSCLGCILPSTNLLGVLYFFTALGPSSSKHMWRRRELVGKHGSRGERGGIPHLQKKTGNLQLTTGKKAIKLQPTCSNYFLLKSKICTFFSSLLCFVKHQLLLVLSNENFQFQRRWFFLNIKFQLLLVIWSISSADKIALHNYNLETLLVSPPAWKNTTFYM